MSGLPRFRSLDMPWAWGLCILLVPVGAGIWLPAISAASPKAPNQLPWALLGVLILGAAILMTDVRFRSHTLSLAPMSGGVAIAIVELRPAEVLAAVFVAQLAHTVVNHPGVLKSSFNLFVRLVGAGSSYWTLHWVLGGASADGLRGWAAVATACVTFDVVTVLLITAAMALAGGQIDRDHLTGTVFTLGLTTPANAVLGVLAVSLLWVSPWGLVIWAGVVVGLTGVLRIQHRQREEYENLDLLYRFSEGLAGLAEAREVLTAVLYGAQHLLCCRDAELVIARPDGNFLRTSLHPTGALVHDETPTFDALEQTVFDSRRALLVDRGEKDPALLRALERRGWRDAMLTPIEGTTGFEGMMVVGDRLGDTTSFSTSDVRLLQTIAAHSTVALRSSELLDRLRQEVAARSHEALHDSLTGLGNRVYFSDRLESALDTRGDRLVGVVMIDLNNFKEINDTLGHHAGDAVLREAGARLTAAVGPAGTAARIGGDEFAVALTGLRDVRDIVDTARRIAEAICEPIFEETLTLNLQASLGVAVAPDDGLDAAVLLRRADVAMYLAKSSEGGLELYDASTDPNTTRRLRLTSDLRTAILEGGLDLWFQPKADLNTGRITGVEALCRWDHPIHGDVSPEEFIPLAEQSGSISLLSWWVLGEALRQLQEWDRILSFPIGMAVNMSARNFMEVGMVDRLADLVAATGLAPRRLTIELTESSIMSDPDRAERVFAQVASLGVQIAIDDFGTGYSSLSRLNRLSVSEIKIDKSFVTNMLTTNTGPIVAATIDLGSSLGLVITAEGVEDRATWDRLREMGCRGVQGYHLARPMAADACTQWLRERQHLRLGLVKQA